MNLVTILKEAAHEVDFDLSARAEYCIPERMERTVYVSPLAANVTPEMVKVMKESTNSPKKYTSYQMYGIVQYNTLPENVLLQKVWSNQVSQDRETSEEEGCLCQSHVCLGGVCPQRQC